MIKIPVGGKSLKCPDGYGIVQFPAATSSFAGVITDATANSREGVTLPDGLDSLHILTGGNLGHVSGNIDSRRTGMLTRRYHEGVAHGGRTFLLPYVGFIFVPEVLKSGEDGVGAGLPQAAKGAFLDRFGYGKQSVHVLFTPFALSNSGQYFQHLFGP